MELVKSILAFSGGTLKRVWWYLPPLLLDPFDIAERLFGRSYLVPQWIAWLLFGLGWAAAIIATYHELRMKNINLKRQLDDKSQRPIMNVKIVEPMKLHPKRYDK